MRKKDGFLFELKKNKVLFIMIFPAVLYFFVFAYLPMGGIVLAFKEFKYSLGVFGSPWAGLDNFKFFFMSGTGWQVTKNTIIYNMVLMISSQGLGLLLAIIFSQLNNKYFKKIFQSFIFMPYFISWVVVGVFIYNIFNYEMGSMNTLLKAFNLDKVDVYSNPGIWIYIIAFFNSWKWAGYLSLIYTSAIMGIDMQSLEAADIDGANIFEKIRFIMLPSIFPTIVIMLLLNVGRLLRGDFQMFYQIVGNNGQLFNATDVIDTYVFRGLTNSQDLGMPAAAGLYQSVLCFIIILIVNGLVRRYDKDYSLF